jgi:hypothetical protein
MVALQGWLTPPLMTCPGVQLTLRDVSFNTPDQLAAMMMTNRWVHASVGAG